MTPIHPRLRLLAELAKFNIEARYPKDRRAMKEVCTSSYVERTLTEVLGAIEWMLAEISRTF